MYYWHFCKNDKRLDLGEACKASEKIIDALKYAQGNIICKVNLGGTIVHDTDKSVATECTVIAMANIGKELHEFACLYAEHALKKAKVREKVFWNTIQAKRDWLDGKITNEQLAAAKFAAWSAAESTVETVAESAAEAAAWFAAKSVAWSTVEAAEINWQNETLTRMVEKKLNR